MIQKLKQERGATLLEFAMVIPLFVGLVMGVINLAFLLNNKLVAESAAREVGRVYASTGDAVKAYEQGEFVLKTGSVGASTVDLQVTPASPGRWETTVVAEAPSPVLVPGLGALLGGSAWETEVKIKEETNYYTEYRHRSSAVKPAPIFVGWWGWSH
ncbi:MAG: TadE/TadG family type IV pilus assembly protein [Candidatus Saccharibacteria bacterium]